MVRVNVGWLLKSSSVSLTQKLRKLLDISIRKGTTNVPKRSDSFTIQQNIWFRRQVSTVSKNGRSGRQIKRVIYEAFSVNGESFYCAPIIKLHEVAQEVGYGTNI